MLNESELDIQLSPNYSGGRQGTPVRRIAFHHVVGSAASAVSKFKQSSSQTSAHFVVAPNKIYCCVDTDNTAWTNGNWGSNLESVTIEHEGDWRFGFRDENVINNSARLVAWLRTLYPSATPIRHRDVASTACPGDLPVEEIWNRATAILNPPKPPAPIVPPAAKLTITDTTGKTIEVTKDTQLWDLSFTTWATAKSVRPLPKGTRVSINATATHPLGGVYYLENYSPAQGVNLGVNVKDAQIYVEPPVPPVVPPVEPVEPPVEPPVVPPVTPPVTPPTSSLLDWVLALLNKIKDFLGSWKRN